MKNQFDEKEYYKNKIEKQLKNPVFQGAINLMSIDMVFLDQIFQLYLLESVGAHHSSSQYYIHLGRKATKRLESFLADVDDDVEEFLAFHVVEIWEFFTRIMRIDKSYYKKNGISLLIHIFSEKRIPNYNEWRVLSPMLVNLFHTSILPVATFLSGIQNTNFALSQQHKLFGLFMAIIWFWVTFENKRIIRQPRYHAELELRRIITKGKTPRSPLYFSLNSEIAIGMARGFIFYILGAFCTSLYEWWEFSLAAIPIIWIISDIIGYFHKSKSS